MQLMHLYTTVLFNAIVAAKYHRTYLISYLTLPLFVIRSLSRKNYNLHPQEEGARKRDQSMSKQRAHPLVERLQRIEEALEHKMDKTDGENLEERVSDLEANQEEFGEKVDDYESQASDVAIQIDSFDEHACHLEGWLASLQSDHNDHLGWISDHESQLSDHESQLSDHESQLSDHDSQISELEKQGTDPEDDLS
jgi:chromosome segregation ATPase